MISLRSLQLPSGGFLDRIRIYTAEMYPVPIRLLSSALLYGSFVTILSRMHGSTGTLISVHSLIGAASVFFLLLLLRLMDELKDKEIDFKLFPDRPLPSGRIFESDIWLSLAGVTVIYIFLNIWVGGALLMALAVLAYAWLMFKFFFIRGVLRRSLLLTLATHNPIIPIMFLYLVALFMDQQSVSWAGLDGISSWLLVMQYWLVLFAWEVARKIRSREEENEYVTYSRIFGRIGAVVVAGASQTVAFALGIYFAYEFSLSHLYLLLITAGYFAVVWGHVRFVFLPNRQTSKLRPFAEAFIIAVLLAGFIENFQPGQFLE